MNDREYSADHNHPPERDGADRDPLGPLVLSLRLCADVHARTVDYRPQQKEHSNE